VNTDKLYFEAYCHDCKASATVGSGRGERAVTIYSLLSSFLRTHVGHDVEFKCKTDLRLKQECPTCRIPMQRALSDYIAYVCPRCGLEAFETDKDTQASVL
jgi:Zn finger protein HypA/HybF involved in hydrogenase expression